jgi:CRP-like cAMP-binding protein
MTRFASSLAGAHPDGATVLDRLEPLVRARLAPLVHEQAFEAGTVILREGADTPFLGVIETGRVALRMRVPERGDGLTIVTIEPGELLGWSAVVAPFRATVDAVATEPTRMLTIAAGGLRARLAIDDELAADLLPLVLESVSLRLTASWTQLLDVFATGTPEPW